MVPLVFSQLVPPIIKNSIQRQHLHKLGWSMLDFQVTLLVAPAGFGKSVWMASLLNNQNWPRTAWLSLDSYDNEVAYAIYHIIYALQRVIPDYGHASLRTVNSLENIEQDWEIALASMLEELPPDQDLVLVLDDYHLIDKNLVIKRLMERFVQKLPSHMHLVLISRSYPTINLYRQQLCGQLLEIDGTSLRFSRQECEQLFVSLGLHLPNTEIESIHAHTEGWPAALRLFAIVLKQSGLSPKDIERTMRASSLYSYLSNEMLAFLPSSLQEFLLGASLLPYLEPDLCEAALQITDGLAIIIELHTQGLLSRSEQDGTTWRLHHLMADFLNHKVYQDFDPPRIYGIRKRASSFLEKKGDLDRALEQVINNLDWKEASRLIKQYGDSYFLKSGRLEALYFWIKRIPEASGCKDHWIHYFEGMSMLHVNQETALSTLSDAARQAETLNDVQCQVRSLLAMIAVHTFSNNVRMIEETARRMPDASALAMDAWSQGVVLVASLSRAAWSDNLHQGVDISRIINKNTLDYESRMAFLMFSSIIQYRLGNFNSAKSLINEAILDPYVQENERWLGTAYVICGIIYWLSGEHQKLKEICAAILRLGSKYKAPHQLGNAHKRLAHLYMLQGQYSEARQELELSRSAFLEGNNIFFSYLNDLDTIWLQIQSGESAAELVQESERLVKVLSGLWGGQGLDDYVLSTAGIIAMEANDLNLAAEHFEEVIKRSSAKGARQVLCGAQLLLAKVRFLQGEEQNGDILLLKALSAAENEKWEFFRDWHPETVYSLCKRALIKKYHPGWAALMLKRWFPDRIFIESGYFLGDSNNAVRGIFSGLVDDLVKLKGRAALHANFLGGFHVYINGKEIPPTAWKTKKAENLLKYLLGTRQTHTKELVIAVLWPEAEPGQADASLRMALSHVRKALGLNNKVFDAITLRRGIVSINPELDCFCDYDLFIRFSEEAIRMPGGSTPRVVELLEQARDLYRGEFLPENLYDDWTNARRRLLHDTYCSILSRLLEIYRLQGQQEKALAACHSYLYLEPHHEQTCRTAMEIFWEIGQKEQAISIYRELSAHLQKDYGIEPNWETTMLYNKICQ